MTVEEYSTPKRSTRPANAAVVARGSTVPSWE
jgi:hypothetical protein